MDEFIAQCLLFFIAGYDTIATSLSMAAYCLAMNQEAQDKLYEEAKEAFANEVERKTYFINISLINDFTQ